MKRVLTVDGGGIRGIIPLAALVRLETEMGKPSHAIFDMVAGTSTGAIIAAGIARGMSARGLLAMYRNLAKQAFQRLPWWEILLNLGNHRYDNRFIRDTLKELDFDLPLNDLAMDIMITAKDTHTSRTHFFVRDKESNASRWGHLSLQDAVLASIAAPTYFPPHTAIVQGVEYTWVDGGVGVAGNPCYQAAVEALHYSGGAYPPGDTQMLSFGTGRSPHPIDAHNAHILRWGTWVLDEMLEDTADWQTFITRREYDDSGRLDFRRYQLDLAPDVMARIGVEVPPDIDVTRIRLDSVWAVHILEEIGKAFAHAIDFEDPDGTELETDAGW